MALGHEWGAIILVIGLILFEVSAVLRTWPVSGYLVGDVSPIVVAAGPTIALDSKTVKYINKWSLVRPSTGFGNITSGSLRRYDHVCGQDWLYRTGYQHGCIHIESAIEEWIPLRRTVNAAGYYHSRIYREHYTVERGKEILHGLSVPEHAREGRLFYMQLCNG